MSGAVKGIARDLLALGGIPFYIIVIARATIGHYSIFIYQLILAAIVLYALRIFAGKANLHIARALILAVFTILFYRDLAFALFAALLWIAAVAALLYLKARPRNVAAGIAIGIASSAAAYYLAPHAQILLQ